MQHSSTQVSPAPLASTESSSHEIGDTNALPNRDSDQISGFNSDTTSSPLQGSINDKNFERIYVQNGINVKPLCVGRIDKDENIVGGEVPVTEDVNDVKNTEEVLKEAKSKISVASDIEKEACKLLKDAVVTY
ncbi:hypothetical protein COLO4_34122 [Corchorus olitorius]|uniref:Uncharacterized protein n=1 Tax=Corchorus olitorius TaxID=93759 RepID=A0A1R3GNI1_9ROSI|nr:hypothetical protein COLO4_34122 [Corchorus olitorius]